MACCYAGDVLQGRVGDMAKGSTGSTTIPDIPECTDDGEQSEASYYDQDYDGEVTVAYLRRHHAAQGADAPIFNDTLEARASRQEPASRQHATPGRDRRSSSRAPRRSSSAL